MNNNRIESIVQTVRDKYGIHGRKFNKQDFYTICEGEGIALITPQTSGGAGPWAPGVIHGCLLRHKSGLQMIYLECFWRKRFDVFTAFHELGHYFAKHKGLFHQLALHKAGEQPDWSNAEEEAEADLFSEICTGRTR